MSSVLILVTLLDFGFTHLGIGDPKTGIRDPRLNLSQLGLCYLGIGSLESTLLDQNYSKSKVVSFF